MPGIVVTDTRCSNAISSIPPAGKKKVINMYYDPATGSIETEVEP